MRVLEFITPKETKFFRFLDEQSRNMLVCAQETKKFIDNYNSLSPEEREEAIIKIKALESKGDQFRHRIAEELNKSFITPIDREDIHRLSYLLDEVLDFVYAAADRLVLYDVKSVNEHIIKFGEVIESIVQATHELVVAIENRNKINIKEKYEKVHKLETDADLVYREALRDLFSKETDPIQIIKLRGIYRLLERVADDSERVADVIESIVIKHG
jgi:hypothetical protein